MLQLCQMNELQDTGGGAVVPQRTQDHAQTSAHGLRAPRHVAVSLCGQCPGLFFQQALSMRKQGSEKGRPLSLNQSHHQPHFLGRETEAQSQDRCCGCGLGHQLQLKLHP